MTSVIAVYQRFSFGYSLLNFRHFRTVLRRSPEMTHPLPGKSDPPQETAVPKANRMALFR
jgi:hypothetical protein